MTTPATPLTVLPAVPPFAAADPALPARLRAGNHRSRQQGPGVEPVAVRPYATGDRLRQVDWRTTSRTGALHVRATTTDSATDVVVLLDTLSDAGPPGGTVLDTAVRAAAGIVDHYLAFGDSVGLVQYGGHLRTLAARSGRGQLARAEEWLLEVRPPLNALVAERSEPWTPTSRHTAALVVALTPLLDERTAVLLATLRRAGRDGRRGRRAAGRRRPRARASPRRPTSPAGCGCSTGRRCAPGSASSACRSCPGAARAASTPCSRRWCGSAPPRGRGRDEVGRRGPARPAAARAGAAARGGARWPPPGSRSGRRRWR